MTMTFLLRGAVASDMQLPRAKSAYASSTITTPLNFFANAAMAFGSANSPVGALGFVQRKREVEGWVIGRVDELRMPTHLTSRIAASVL